MTRLLTWRRAEDVSDGLLALALTVFAQLDLRFNIEAADHYGSELVAALVTAVATLALALRRRAPLACACVVAAAAAVPELFGTLTIQLWGDFVPLLIAAYSVTRHGSQRTAAIGTGVLAAALLVVELRVPVVGTTANIPFTWIPFLASCAAGRVLQTREQRHADVSDQARRLATERDEKVREAIAEERARIARELHDIVAHSVSVMVVQAGAAEDLLDRDPQRARPPLLSIQESGRQAVADLSRMLGLLRSEDAALARAPQPRTAQLGELLAQMEKVGLPVSLTTEGTPRDLTPGVELAGFRIVQEALTNTLKHAGPATAAVRLRYADDALEIEVVDDGRGGRVNGRGHGLIGMRERVTLYGGTLDAGPRPDGGFAVRARLPLEPSS
ncbi:MAG: sensor histidine kinase [Thermoleophilaceae bacterium]